jgi:D-3-phosphoglycerate dehydrogenase / 2-oxoglutarate reductase
VATYRVAIADNTFAPIDPERAELEPLGCEIVFAQCATEDDVIDLARDADAIICDAAPVTARVLAETPRVKVVSEYGIGYDNIDVEAATARGIWVTNVPGFCTSEVADHTIAMLLAVSRRLLVLDAAVREGKWGAGVAGPMRRLGTQTLGLVGFGRIARSVATRAQSLGMRVLCWSPSVTPAAAEAIGATRVELDEIFRQSDYVSLHVPATPSTRRLVDARRLGLLKPSACLINTGRGSLVDEPALIDALRAGRLEGAALDVYDPEPPRPDNPLFELGNVILTPHAAFYSEESLAELQVSAARNVAAALRGERPPTPVNQP